MKKIIVFFLMALSLTGYNASAQRIQWDSKGEGFYEKEEGAIVHYTVPSFKKTVILSPENLKAHKDSALMDVEHFNFSNDQSKLLLFTHTQRVWRMNTKGDYWVFDLKSKSKKQIGKKFEPSTLMFAKFSPDATKVAYVQNYNLYVEDLATGSIKALTTGGNRKMIYGTFDWAYEEEFYCRDGFRWSPDGNQIAFWRIDAAKTPDYYMLNQTDEIYPQLLPVEYPVAGIAPSSAKIGVVNIRDAKVRWMNIATDTVWKTYLPRMEWYPNGKQLIVQQLNRKQNESKLLRCDVNTGGTQTIYIETDQAWIDILPSWDEDYIMGGWDWLSGGKDFLWASEKDGWRHLYRMSADGKNETLLTKGAFDVLDIAAVDEARGYLYFHASPLNATQKYLYRCTLDGNQLPERITEMSLDGTHEYQIAPGASIALHEFNSHKFKNVWEFIALPSLEVLEPSGGISKKLKNQPIVDNGLSFFTVTTSEGITMDGWMKKPKNFDSTKQYPVVFYVYSEPAGQTVKDENKVDYNRLYDGDMSKDGYIYISIDNRGTPVPKGREWRKSIYKNIGTINIRDQALAATEILKWPFIDKERVAVWGWSGGGSATLNLMFQYPEIYKTGISIAAVGNQLTYDNIYQERYMGLPQENKNDFLKGSPITHVKGLKGNLLYIHGTGDDNVHYNNAEMLVNQLIKHQKQFQLMSYPNRSHGISEGEGTRKHLMTLYTQYLKTYCPPGPRKP